MIGCTFDAFPDRRGFEEQRAAGLRAMSTGQVVEFELMHTGSDGRERAFNVVAFPILGANGQISGVG